MKKYEFLLLTSTHILAGLYIGWDSWRNTTFYSGIVAAFTSYYYFRNSFFLFSSLIASFFSHRFVCIGLTGGIASGKSSVSELFKKSGIIVIDADEAARTVVKPGASALKKLEIHFGSNVLLEDGTLNRRWLRERISQDTSARKIVNSITHPAIAYEIFSSIVKYRWWYGNIVVVDAALLYEAGLMYQILCRPVICVVAPDSQRIERIVKRDNTLPDQAKALLNAQMPQEEKARKAQIVLQNDGSIEDLQVKVSELIVRFKRWW